MDNLTPTSIVALFETNKAQRELFVNQVVNNVLSGDTDVMKLHKQVKAMEEVVKEITSNKAYKSHLLECAMLHGKSFDYMGDEWSVRETGVTYDFDNCDDKLLNEMNTKMEELMGAIKARQAWLKALPAEGATIVDEETGEVYKLNPPIKKSTTAVTIKLK